MSYVRDVLRSYATLKRIAAQELKSRKFWSKMTLAKANEYADALAIEVGMDAAGKFMGEFNAMKAAGYTAA